MIPTTGYLFQFTPESGERLAVVTGTYFDDTLYAGTEYFERERKLSEAKLESNTRSYDHMTFSGIEINKSPDGYFMCQDRYARRMAKNVPDSDYEAFGSLRHKMAWLGHSRPELIAPVNILSHITAYPFTG